MDQKPLVAIFKKECSYIITEATVNSVKNTSIQSENHIQTWTRPTYSRLLSKQSHSENNTKEMPGMQLSINAVQSTTNTGVYDNA